MRKYVLGFGIVLSGCTMAALGWRALPTAKDHAGRARLPQVSVSSHPSRIDGTTPVHAVPSALNKSRVNPGIALQYSKLPLAFEPNEGQINKDADFVARGDGYSVFLTPQESVVVLNKVSLGASKKQPGVAATENDNRRPAVLRMQLIGANREARFSPLDELPGMTNYFIGNEPSKWHVNIRNYKKVEQRSVYPGVDLDYYGTQRQLEYDFLISPGTDPSVIRFAFAGARKLRTDSHGDLIIAAQGGDVILRKPVAYQMKSHNEKEIVAANYAVSADRSVAFQLGKYDPTRQLVIDPILSYSTYLGGSDIDGAFAIAVAPDNTAFITGGTFSTDFPAVHALQPNRGGADDFYADAFVSKLSADGSTLLYSTYLGGENEDVGYGIAVDSLGDAYVTGTTESPHFPVPSTVPSIDPNCGGDGQCGATFNPGHLLVRNGFITKLNPEGSSILYSGFIGFYENVIGQAIVVDNNQVAYVIGQKEPDLTPTVPIVPPNVPPPPFPITANAAQTVYGGGATDAYVMKISASGNTILYSTYIGGSNEDVGLGIAVDPSGMIYATGLTYSTDFPITAGTAIQATNAGAGDAFLTKINSAGGPFVYSTFLGGNGLDQGNGIAVDSAGNAYITGGTVSRANTLGFVPPAGAYQADCALDSSGVCEGDAFVAKFNASGALSYFTYLGGSLADAGYGIAIDTSGGDPLNPCIPSSPCAVVTGSTVSTDFVPGALSATAFQPKYGGGNADAFVTKLSPTGSSLIYSSYLGGTNTDIGYGVAVDTSGNAYVAGQTCSLDFPLANPEQPASGGNCDAFVSKVSILHGLQLNPAGLVFNGQSLGTVSQAQTITVTNGDATETVSLPTLAGPNSGDFQIITTSPSSCANFANLQPGQQCTVTVTFTPLATASAEPLRKAQVSIPCPTCGTSPGGINYVASLTGQLSNLTLSASNLAFGNQQVGVASAAIPITATNIGTTAISFSGITASGDFSETDDCAKVPLQPTTNCVINVTFTPSTAGSSIAALTLADTASGSPQIILLTGTGVGLKSDFTFSVTPNGAIVSAGQAASFSLMVGSIGGFNQPVILGCGGLPRNANCEGASNQVTPTAPPTPFNLVVTTGLRTSVPPHFSFRRGPFNGLWLMVLGLTAMLIIVILTTLKGGQVRLATASFGLAAILLLGSYGCNSGGQAGVPAGTPAGTYQVTVVGTSGSITHTATVSLQVN